MHIHSEIYMQITLLKILCITRLFDTLRDKNSALNVNYVLKGERYLRLSRFSVFDVKCILDHFYALEGHFL